MKKFTKVTFATFFILSIIGCNNIGTSIKVNDSKPEDIIRQNAEDYLNFFQSFENGCTLLMQGAHTWYKKLPGQCYSKGFSS